MKDQVCDAFDVQFIEAIAKKKIIFFITFAGMF